MSKGSKNPAKKSLSAMENFGEFVEERAIANLFFSIFAASSSSLSALLALLLIVEVVVVVVSP